MSILCLLNLRKIHFSIFKKYFLFIMKYLYPNLWKFRYFINGKSIYNNNENKIYVLKRLNHFFHWKIK